MTVFDAKNNEQFRESTTRQLWLSHVRKHCACGKVITEKQLKQYGKCKTCAGKKAA